VISATLFSSLIVTSSAVVDALQPGVESWRADHNNKLHNRGNPLGHRNTIQRVSPSNPTRTGRRVGNSGTRDAILDAATNLFGQRGYDGASIRAIAAAAQVDPALIRHFFKDKDTLFATVVADRTTVFERLAESLTGDPATLGHRLTDTYLRLWEEPETGPILMAIARSATTSERAAEMLRTALSSSIRNRTGEPNSEHALRLALAGSQLFGLAVARHIIKVPALAQPELDDLITQVAPTVQRHLTGAHP
jgi:AcrR family transcriptional regulator